MSSISEWWSVHIPRTRACLGSILSPLYNSMSRGCFALILYRMQTSIIHVKKLKKPYCMVGNIKRILYNI